MTSPPLSSERSLSGDEHLQWGGALAGVFLCIVLPWLDLPRPGGDDLFYVGAAIELAKGGELTNPWIVGQGFPSRFFFMYPPVHSYVLSGWLRVFGINTSSLLYFQAACYLTAGWSIHRLLRERGIPLGFLGSVLIGVIGLLEFGLRAEPLAAAFLLLGYLAWTQRGDLVRGVGAALLYASVFTAPRFLLPVALAGLLGAFEFGGGPFREQFGRVVRERFAPAAIAAAIVLFGVSWMIGFRVSEFIDLFRFHAKVRFGGVRGFPHSLMTLAFALPPGALLAWTMWCRRSRISQLPGWKWSTVLGGLAIIVTLSGTDINGRLAYSSILLAGSAILFAGNGPEGRGHLWMRRAWVACLFVPFFLVTLHWHVEAAARLTGRAQRTSAAAHAELRTQLAAVEGRNLVVDAAAARYVFSYSLPAGARDFGFLLPLPGSGPDRLDQRRENEVWVVSRHDYSRFGYKDIIPRMDGGRWLPMEAFRYPKYLRAIYIFGGNFGPSGTVLEGSQYNQVVDSGSR